MWLHPLPLLPFSACPPPAPHLHPSPQIEALDMCERAYVHVDWAKRDYFEHKVGSCRFMSGEISWKLTMADMICGQQ